MTYDSAFTHTIVSYKVAAVDAGEMIFIQVSSIFVYYLYMMKFSVFFFHESCVCMYGTGDNPQIRTVPSKGEFNCLLNDVYFYLC